MLARIRQVEVDLDRYVTDVGCIDREHLLLDQYRSRIDHQVAQRTSFDAACYQSDCVLNSAIR